MKLIKFVPAFLATVVLAACSSQPKPEEVLAKADQVGVNKVVAYSCENGNDLKVTYSFVDGQAKTAKILLNDQAIPDTLIRNPKNKDFAAFTALAGGYTFNADAALNVENYATLNPGILFKHAKTDEVQAKGCTVNTQLTELLNK
ncbi:hypothetical protein [Conservatibacter flavescens]|uniref:Excinuclease ABC subunit A n=1 Tax=Conservatibacter flavescens TaxID=28161 RepID=A0A2M8S3U7_9PAST|nr:hypothetical protein [Conservatibacter flavescens]PJG85822.1 hypothetical protein CVP05_04565 [Conservatibacter flavescens]